MQRPFETAIDGISITGVVDKPDNQELCDYYVTADIGDRTYKFRMILVSTPPRYTVNMLEVSDKGSNKTGKRIFIQLRQWDLAEWVFSAALDKCVTDYRSKQNV